MAKQSILTAADMDKIAREYDGKTKTIDRLVKELNISRTWLVNRAKTLGKTSPRRPWTTKEEKYLRDNWGRVPAEEIAKTLNRSVNSLVVRKVKLGISIWDIQNDIGYNIKDLESITGVDHRLWGRFIDSGELKVRQLRTVSQAMTRVVSIEDLHKFLKKRPEFFNYRGLSLRHRMMLELDRLPDPPLWKEITCRSSSIGGDGTLTKASMMPCGEKGYSFWYSTYHDQQPLCPRCGCRVTQYSETQNYSDDDPGEAHILKMLGEKLGLKYRKGKYISQDGKSISDKDLIKYAFNTKRNPATAFQVFSKLLRSGLTKVKEKKLSTAHICRSLVDYKLKSLQLKAWHELLRTSCLGLGWPPGEGKMFFGAYVLSRIKGRHLIFVHTKTLVQQWSEFFQDHIKTKCRVRTCWHPKYVEVTLFDAAGGVRTVIDIFNYQTRADLNTHSYRIVIYDECQFLVGNSAHDKALIKCDARLFMSATAVREDGRDSLLTLLSGKSLLIDWEECLKNRGLAKSQIRVIVTESLDEKYEACIPLIDKRKRSLIFIDSLEHGRELNYLTGLPFVYSGTKNRMKVIREHKQIIISRVGDHGLDITDLQRIVEFSFFRGSRMQELQRYGRLLHSKKTNDHIILMTRAEFSRFNKRLVALEQRGFKLTIELFNSAINTRKAA